MFAFDDMQLDSLCRVNSTRNWCTRTEQNGESKCVSMNH